MLRLTVIISFLSTCLILSSCSYFNSNGDTHRVVCNKLKSDLVFNGATSNTRQAEIEGAEAPLQQHNYNAYNCDSQ